MITKDEAYIDALLDRFMRAETTEQEEEVLEHYFTSDTSVPERWKAYQQLFCVLNDDELAFSEEEIDSYVVGVDEEETTDNHIQYLKKKSSATLWFAIGLSIAAGIALFFFLWNPSEEQLLEPRKIAHVEPEGKKNIEIVSGSLIPVTAPTEEIETAIVVESNKTITEDTTAMNVFAIMVGESTDQKVEIISEEPERLTGMSDFSVENRMGFGGNGNLRSITMSEFGDEISITVSEPEIKDRSLMPIADFEIMEKTFKQIYKTKHVKKYKVRYDDEHVTSKGKVYVIPEGMKYHKQIQEMILKNYKYGFAFKNLDITVESPWRHHAYEKILPADEIFIYMNPIMLNERIIRLITYQDSLYVLDVKRTGETEVSEDGSCSHIIPIPEDWYKSYK